MGESLSNLISDAGRRFDERFEKTFALSAKGFNEKQIEFGKMMIGNMLGGIGYFYGSAIVDTSIIGLEGSIPIDSLDDMIRNAEVDDYFADDEEFDEVRQPDPKLVSPTELFTGVPSRPFFPRGFLW